MTFPSGQNTIKVSDNGQLECAITVTAYNAASDTYTVTVEGRIRNIGSSRVFHSTANITCSITGQVSFTGSNFSFDLNSGETLTFISQSFNVSQEDVGNNGLDFTVHYGTTSTTAFGDNKSCGYALPVRPAQPSPPVFTNLTPISVTVSWNASANNGGSAITSYKLRRWLGSPGHGDYVDNDADSLIRNVTGLVPGQTYGFAVYAQNKSGDNGGFSDPSTGESVTMPSGAWIRLSSDTGVSKWYITVPYIRSGGKWKLAEAHVRSSGTWHVTS